MAKLKKKVKEEPKKEFTDPLSLEQVDHLGPAAIKVLKEHGIFTTLQLKHKNPNWLRGLTGYGKAECEAVFQQITERLVNAKLITQQQQSGSEILDSRLNVQKIATGCKTMDNLLTGGMECGSLTELYGENGAGKTQIVHTMAIQVQRPVSEGGAALEHVERERLQKELMTATKLLAKMQEAKEPKEKISEVEKQIDTLNKKLQPPIVFFIASEETFRPERIMSIAAARGLIIDYPAEIKHKVAQGKELKPEEQEIYNKIRKQQIEEVKEKYLDNIIHSRVTDAQAQCKEVENLISITDAIPIKLIIVDSGTALFRVEFLGLGNMKGKFELMGEMLSNLKRIAELKNIAVIAVNQIYHDPDGKMGADEDVPYGGNVWGHALTYRLKIEKSGKHKKITIKKSPYQAENFIKFDITAAGPTDFVE